MTSEFHFDFWVVGRVGLVAWGVREPGTSSGTWHQPTHWGAWECIAEPLVDTPFSSNGGPLKRMAHPNRGDGVPIVSGFFTFTADIRLSGWLPCPSLPCPSLPFPDLVFPNLPCLIASFLSLPSSLPSSHDVCQATPWT